eukprot:scpid8662/ scgid3019/ 
MDRAEDSLPFLHGSSGNLPQLRSELSASLLGMSGLDSASLQDDSLTGAVAAASGIPRNLDSIGNVSPHRTRSIRDHEAQMSDLKKENFSLKLRIYFLEERVKIAQQNVDGGDGEFQLNIDLQVEVAQLKNDNQDKQVLLQRAATAIDTLTRNNDELQEGHTAGEGLRAELTTAREELERLQQESKFHHDRYQEASSELGSLKSIQEDHIGLRRHHDNLVQQTTAEKAKLEDQLNEAQQEIDRVRGVLTATEEAKQQLNDAHSASSSLAEQLPALRSELHDKIATIQDLKRNLADVSGKNKNLAKERDDIQTAESKKSLELRLEIRTRDARIADLESEVAHQQELLKGVEANLRESHGTSAQRAAHHYEELMAQHTKDLADTREKLQAARQQVTQKDVQIAALESQLAERDGRLAMSATEVDSKSDALQLATTNAQKNADHVKELGAQLKERNAELARLRQQLADTQDRLDAAAQDTELQSDQDAAQRDSQLRALTRELDKLRAALDKERQSKGTLQENIDALKDALSSKEQSLQNVRRQLDHSAQLHRQRQTRLEQQYRDQIDSLTRDLSRRDEAASRLSEALQEKEEAIRGLSEMAGRLSGDGSSDHRDLHVRQLTNQIMELRRKIEQLTQDSDARVDDLEKQLLLLRRQNSKLQRELKESQDDLQQSKRLSKRKDDANESRDNLLDVLNQSLGAGDGDETAMNLLQAELTARENEIAALTSQLHEKEKELQALRADHDQTQKSHADFAQQLQASLQQKDSTIESLLRAGKDKDEQLLRLTEDSMSRSGQNASTRSQLDDLRDANAKLESMAKSRETQLQSYLVAAQAKDGVIKSLQEQLQMQRGRLSMSPSRRTPESIEADLLTVQAQLKASQELVDVQRRQLNEARQEKERLQKQLDAITMEAMALGSGPSPGSDGFATPDRSRTVDDEAVRLRGKLSDADALTASVRSQLADAQRQSQALQAQLDVEKLAASQASRVAEKLRRCEADLARARSTVEELREELSSRDAQLQDLARLQAQLKSSQAERDLLQQRIDGMRKVSDVAVGATAAELQNASQELARLQEANRKLREDLLHANDDVRIITAEKSSLQNSLGKVHDDLQSKQASLKQQEAELQHLRAELVSAQTNLSASKASLTAAQDECSRLRHELQVAESKLRDRDASLHSAQADASALRSSMSTQQGQQRELIRDKQTAEATAATQLSSIASLRLQLEELTNSLAVERAANSNLRQQLLEAQRELSEAQDTVMSKRHEADTLGSELHSLRLRSADTLRSSDVSDVASQADSLPDLGMHYQAETARLRQELEATRHLVDQLSAERNAMEQRCRELARDLAEQAKRIPSSQSRSIGVGSHDSRPPAVHLDSDLLQRVLSAHQAEAELQRELRHLLRHAGYSSADIDRLLPPPQPATSHARADDGLASLRTRYSEGVHANEQLRTRLQDQLTACESDRQRWQRSVNEQNKLTQDLQRRQQQSTAAAAAPLTSSPSPRGRPIDLSVVSGLTMEDLQGLCKDLSQSLRASQALQADLQQNLSNTGGAAPLFLQHEKDRLAGDVVLLNDRLTRLQEENRKLRARLETGIHTDRGSSTSPAQLTELERELQQSHAIAARMRDTLATREHELPPATLSSTSPSRGQPDHEALAAQLSGIRHALQQHTQASQSLRDWVSQPRQSSTSSPGKAAQPGSSVSTGTTTAMTTTTGLPGGFVHMERQVRGGLDSLSKLEAAIATANEHVDANTVHHLLQLARQVRAQLEAAEALLSQLKNVAPMAVSSSVENALLKAESADLRRKLAAHEKVMYKALQHIQKSKDDKERSSSLYAHLQHTDDIVQQSKRNIQSHTTRYQS